MLKLRKLHIVGFKSFCDRTELKFHGEGVAAVVGPNGCGKSNISDAISWVLGEQSAKTLRGARMEDVIFAGTRDRKPTGMAEVSLTLIDPQVYGGADVAAEPVIEIEDEMPSADGDDWDEASLRAEASAEAEQYIEEVRPLGPIEVPVPADGESAEGATAQPAETSEGHAEAAAPHVVLKIRRRTLKRPEFKAGEIMVTRRLFRSGESEYLLNGKLCRLRDIQELFMGTGLGPESYAIIEQGRIGQILSSKPHDRRAILEEAAGVTRFKTKKRLAEARLEQSKLNLARVNDIFDEVTRQMGSLKRQAAKAERYGRLRDELRARLRVVLASRFAGMTAEQAAHHAQLASLNDDVQARSENLRVQETEHQACTEQRYAFEEESRAVAERVNQANREMDRARAGLAHNQERCAELEARMTAGAAETSAGAAQCAALEVELGQGQISAEGAAAELARVHQEAAIARQQAADAAAEVGAAEAEQERSRAEIMRLLAAAAELRNQATQARERAGGLQRDSNRLQQEMAVAQQEIEAFGGRRGQFALEFEGASQRASALAEQIACTRDWLQQRRSEETEAKRQLDGLRAEFATALGRKASLEAVIAEHGYSTESVKRLFRSGAFEDGKAPVGVLADFLEVEQQYEHVVEDFLRDELNFIVVKSWDAADQGLHMLRTDVDGRATFLVHPSDAQARFSFAFDESMRPQPSRSASALPLSHCIRVLNGFGKSLEVILPKLREGFIVPDAAQARELALDSPDAFFLAKSGECFHNVTVTGGKQRSEGPLSMKRELREVSRLVNDLEAALREQEAKVGLLGREIAGLVARLENLEAEKRDVEKEALTSGHTLKQLDQEIGRATERLHAAERELDRVRTECEARLALATEREVELGASDSERRQLEEAAVASQERLASLKSARDAASNRVAEMAGALAATEERRKAALIAVQRVSAMLAETRTRQESLQRQMTAAAAERDQRLAQDVQFHEQIVTLVAECERGAARVAELQLQSEQVRARLTQLEEAARSERAALDQARDRRAEVGTALARLDSDVQHLRQDCVQELGAQPEELLQSLVAPPLAAAELGAEDTACREMRSRLDAMGPVNMMALEEYNETAQRHGFLDTQRKDLLESIQNTESTIREIETVSRQMFQEAFVRINANFQQTFTKLFGGGSALLRLTDEENGAESGIDIVASPPGKKLQNVLLLSGGEKALTALALLVGIFQYQPSPFCILDEVDAPLDEANVGRFVEMVREMSVQTQFILITHSKRTMSVAPVMYGVTMQEPGVSKVVSVRFGAEALSA